MTSATSTPKRKRMIGPTVVTSFVGNPEFTEWDPSAGGSPRTQVASKFSNLQLRHGELHTAHTEEDDRIFRIPGSPRKRLRFEAMAKIDIGSELDISGNQTKTLGNQPQTTNERIPEYDEHQRQDKPRQTSPTVWLPVLDIPDKQTKHQDLASSLHSKRKKSPPPPSNKDNPSPLVWHDWEISGHLMDSPDDDGVGINGIGFRPTPQMKHTQTQKRKQQIANWKAREAREARERRSERRRINGGIGASYGPTAARNEDDDGIARRQRVRFDA